MRNLKVESLGINKILKYFFVRLIKTSVPIPAIAREKIGYGLVLGVPIQNQGSASDVALWIVDYKFLLLFEKECNSFNMKDRD